MDKSGIKNFAIEARKILRESAIKKAGVYGITAYDIGEPVQKLPDSEVFKTVAGNEIRLFADDLKKRNNLVSAIRSLGFEQVIEETAYTWFNRLIAIRFMEVNDYLPSRVRVLSSEVGGSTPDIVRDAMEVDLNLSQEELEKIQKAKDENRYDDAFQMLFVKQCNELNAILPGLFEKTDDYMELLLDISYTGDGVVRMLTSMIPEDDFNVDSQGQVEIIGWMYQYYNTELKDDTFAKLKKNIKITKERIPAATQLFTPDWIVRYMVENSLGRVWIDHLRAVDETIDEKTKAEEFGWKYYLPEAEQEETVTAELVKVRAEYKDLTPQDILCIDPCSGSGHILVYMFDVLLGIYESEGISERDAAFDILEKNIFGLDIDKRAYQLSYFALMMKGRGVAGRRFFRGVETEDGDRRPIQLNVYAIDESNGVDKDILDAYGVSMPSDEREKAKGQVETLLSEMYDAKEYGSIINVTDFDMELVRRYLTDREESGQLNIGHMGAEREAERIWRLAKIGKVLAQKYDVVVTNPPYMSISNASQKVIDYVNNQYEAYKADMFSAFIKKCSCVSRGIFSLITQHSWMFLVSFEKMRKDFLNEEIVNMIHLGAHAFEEISGEVVQTVTFVSRKTVNDNYLATYIRLVDVSNAIKKESSFFNNKFKYFSKRRNYYAIDSCPIAYWASLKTFAAFKNKKVGDIYEVKSGLSTGENNIFLRHWYEVEDNHSAQFYNYKNDKIHKWIPYNKGGGIRKWYGINNLVVLWGENGEDIKQYGKAVFRNPSFYLKEGITWSGIASTGSSFRYCRSGFIFDSNKGPMIFEKNNDIRYVLGLLNTKVVQGLLGIFNPTISLQIGDVMSIPIVLDDNKKEIIINIVNECIDMSKNDWDSFETSWDFKRHPLLPPILGGEVQEQKNSTVEKDGKADGRFLGDGKESEEYTREELEFVTFCIENMAEKLGKDSVDIYDAWTKKSNLLYDYIIPCYDILHTQGKEYILDNIQETMAERGIQV